MLQNWSLTIRYSLVSYVGHTLERCLIPLQRLTYSTALADWAVEYVRDYKFVCIYIYIYIYNLWNMRVKVIPIVISATWNGHKRLGKWAERVGNQSTHPDRPNYGIVEDG